MVPIVFATRVIRRHGEDTGTFHMSFHVSYQDKDTELLAKSSVGISIVE